MLYVAFPGQARPGRITAFTSRICTLRKLTVTCKPVPVKLLGDVNKTVLLQGSFQRPDRQVRRGTKGLLVRPFLQLWPCASLTTAHVCGTDLVCKTQAAPASCGLPPFRCPACPCAQRATKGAEAGGNAGRISRLASFTSLARLSHRVPSCWSSYSTWKRRARSSSGRSKTGLGKNGEEGCLLRGSMTPLCPALGSFSSIRQAG